MFLRKNDSQDPVSVVRNWDDDLLVGDLKFFKEINHKKKIIKQVNSVLISANLIWITVFYPTEKV
jgi:hypothetical protein